MLRSGEKAKRNYEHLCLLRQKECSLFVIKKVKIQKQEVGNRIENKSGHSGSLSLSLSLSLSRWTQHLCEANCPAKWLLSKSQKSYTHTHTHPLCNHRDLETPQKWDRWYMPTNRMLGGMSSMVSR